MLNRVFISLFLLLFGIVFTTGAQIAPVCGGNIIRYGITGLPNSEFFWSIDTAAGTIVKTYANGDSVEIEYNMVAGTYNIDVREISEHNCDALNTFTVDIINSIYNRYDTVSICEGIINLNSYLAASEINEGAAWYYNSKQLTTTSILLNQGNNNYFYKDTNATCSGYVHLYLDALKNNLSFSEITTTNISCYNLSDGSIHANVSGGTDSLGNYFYAWDSVLSGWGKNQLDNIAINSTTGSRSIKLSVKDIKNCKLDSTITITQPLQIQLADSSIQHSSCPDKNDGIINVTFNGGTVPYDIKWSNGTYGEDNTELLKGEYTVTVKDQNGCEITKTFELLSLTDECLNIPNIFTPNGDGNNDVWEIPGLADTYPNAVMNIYDRWGTLIFASTKGYPNEFNGKYKGKLLPVDSYHFILELNNGKKKRAGAIIGTVTILY